MKHIKRKKIDNPILVGHLLLQAGILTISIVLALELKQWSFFAVAIVPLCAIITQYLSYGSGFKDYDDK